MDDNFLCAIIANPHDDSTRLVYADYLNEQGEADRAEFIRVQVELATLPQGPMYIDPSSADDRAELKRADLLRARQLELFSAHGREWFAVSLGGEIGLKCDCEITNINTAMRKADKWCVKCDGSGRIVTDTTVRVLFPRILHPDPYGGMQDIVYTVARGFFESVALTLAQFVGAACGWPTGNPELQPSSHKNCPHCSATGRVNSHAATIFRQSPTITSVVLSDKHPFQNDTWNENDDDQNELRYLPSFIFRRLEGGKPSGDGMGNRWRTYPDADAARHALSTACVQWGREMALSKTGAAL